MHWVNYLAIAMHLAVVIGAVLYFVTHRKDRDNTDAAGAVSVVVAGCASAAWLMVNTVTLHLAAVGQLEEPLYVEYWILPAAFLGMASCINIASHWLWGEDG